MGTLRKREMGNATGIYNLMLIFYSLRPKIPATC
jgi:hypothetical protein